MHVAVDERYVWHAPRISSAAMLIDERSALLKSLEERARSLAETYAWTDGAMNVIAKMLLRREEKAELLAALGALRGHSRAGRDAAHALKAALERRSG
jgi:hypothetical protein